MSYRYILSEQDEHGVVTLTINDPDAKNAVNWDMNIELFEELTRIDEDSSARAVILTGSGTIFCSGGNIKRMTAQGKSLLPPSPTMRQQMNPHSYDIKRVILSLRSISKPVIGAINGPAVGSGIGLAAGCDVRFASTTARFAWVYARRGIVPDDGSIALLPQILGYPKTFEWGMSGETLSAEEALKIGFVSHVVAPETLIEKAHEYAMRIVENVPPQTAQLFKMALADTLYMRPEDAVRITERAQRLSRETEDHSEALRAYAEKRPPVWKGK